ncbi:hypothetical protein KY385_02915 [Candidatus Parcubacteria bacterium]|nr:hypothetical protein [Candidatus Parcubacteria bacterium]
MKAYQAKNQKLPGTSYREIEPRARHLYNIERKRTKRNAYIRSAFFKNDKIFLTRFWNHLSQKRQRDRKRRLKYFPCGLELVRHSRIEPVSKENPNKRSEILHRFVGITPDKEIFFVQIIEDKKSGNKYLISIFPAG